ncbi:MAG: tetratricopeptide repeat protein, partial [Pseudolabrys sp.]
MADIFHEVDEEVRREQLKKLWDRYSLYLIAAAILIVAAIAAWRGYEYWVAKRAATAGAAFEAAMSLSEQSKYTEAEAAFAKVAAEAPEGYRV